MWLPALAAASIIKVIMAGQRMRQPARGGNGSYTALLAAEADIHPSMAMCKLRPGGAIVRPCPTGLLDGEEADGLDVRCAGQQIGRYFG